MERHKSYQILSPLIKSYPNCAGPLFATYNDLTLDNRRALLNPAHSWQDIEVIELPSCSRGALRGHNPDTDSISKFSVIPCSLADELSMEWLSNAFKDLGEPPEIILAIVTDDSSIVYYKISQGLVKLSL